MFRRNLPLVFGMGIPALLILFVAGSIYLPGLFGPKPHYGFLYATGAWYGEPYYVADGHVAERDASSTVAGAAAPVPYPKMNPQLFVYDPVVDANRAISLEDAAKFSLDVSAESPDGFTVVQGNGGGGFFPFFYRAEDYQTRYLVGHGVSRKLDLQGVSAPYSYGNFLFLGWISQ